MFDGHAWLLPATLLRCKTLRTSAPRSEVFRSALINAGYRCAALASLTHPRFLADACIGCGAVSVQLCATGAVQHQLAALLYGLDPVPHLPLPPPTPRPPQGVWHARQPTGCEDGRTLERDLGRHALLGGGAPHQDAAAGLRRCADAALVLVS